MGSRLARMCPRRLAGRMIWMLLVSYTVVIWVCCLQFIEYSRVFAGFDAVVSSDSDVCPVWTEESLEVIDLTS
jgi:hypothetical protein